MTTAFVRPGEQGVRRGVAFGHELLNRREHHAARRNAQQCAKTITRLACSGVCRSSSLHREKVPKSWSSRSFRSVITTMDGFSSLRSTTSRPAWNTIVRLLPEPVCARSRLPAVAALARRFRRRLDGLPDRVELVIAGQLLRERVLVIFEDDEMPDEIEKTARRRR